MRMGVIRVSSIIVWIFVNLRITVPDFSRICAFLWPKNETVFTWSDYLFVMFSVPP